MVRNLKQLMLMSLLAVSNVAFCPLYDGSLDVEPIDHTTEPSREEQERAEREKALHMDHNDLSSHARRSTSSMSSHNEDHTGSLPEEPVTEPRFRSHDISFRRTSKESADHTQRPTETVDVSKELFDTVTTPHLGEPTASTPPQPTALTEEEIAALTPETVAKLSPEDIANMSMDIVHLTPETLKALSPAQTSAITYDQLIYIFNSPELLESLNVANVHPGELVKSLSSRSTHGQFSAEFVTKLTPLQARAIMASRDINVSEHFTADGIATIKEKAKTVLDKARDAVNRKIAAGKATAHNARRAIQDKANNAKSKITETINKGVKWVTDFFNRGRDERGAKIIARNKANGRSTPNEDQVFADHMDKLTTKEKESVANTWLDERSRVYRTERTRLQRQINETMDSKLLSSEEKETKTKALTDELDTLDTKFNSEIKDFASYIKPTLTPNEVIINLSAETDASFKAFEIFDMSTIDPTKSIDAQLEKLDRSVHVSYEGARGKITAQALTDAYVTWFAKQITLDPSKSFADQLQEQAQTITNGTKFSDMDPSIQQAVLKAIDHQLVSSHDTAEAKEVEKYATTVEAEQHGATVTTGSGATAGKEVATFEEEVADLEQKAPLLKTLASQSEGALIASQPAGRLTAKITKADMDQALTALGLEPDVKVYLPKEVEAAYKKLVLQLHPDRNARETAAVRKQNEDRMKAVTEAYQKLNEVATEAQGEPAQLTWTTNHAQVAAREAMVQVQDVMSLMRNPSLTPKEEDEAEAEVKAAQTTVSTELAQVEPVVQQAEALPTTVDTKSLEEIAAALKALENTTQGLTVSFRRGTKKPKGKGAGMMGSAIPTAFGFAHRR